MVLYFPIHILIHNIPYISLHFNFKRQYWLPRITIKDDLGNIVEPPREIIDKYKSDYSFIKVAPNKEELYLSPGREKFETGVLQIVL
jgi:hypothetical protein